MALNLDVIGKKFEPTPGSYNQDDVILYALGIGAGVDELDFVYEKNLKVFPTFAVIPFFPSFMPLLFEAGINLPTVLHGEHKIILHGPLPPASKIKTYGSCASVYDKGDKGAVLNWEFKTYDDGGRLLFENQAAIMDRSAGGFGGDRGPKPEKFEPEAGVPPDFQVVYATSPDQAALYRLSGDKNPLHIDPDFAKMGGLDRPILHGLCTFGFTGRAILHALAKGDPGRVKSFTARFMGLVFPGDTLTISGWKMAPDKYIIQTTTQDGRTVLGNAVAELN
jgi:acyl dehydratase